MAKNDRPPLTAYRAAFALALAAVGGFVDVFGYLSLNHVFTATMSGNTVLIAVHAEAGDRSAALLHAYAVAMFVAGLLVSGVAIELGLRYRFRRILAVALAVEAGCLAALAWQGPDQRSLLSLVALAAFSMGLQNISLRTAGVLSVFTTHVTGTLTRLGEQFVACAFAIAARLGRRRAKDDGPAPLAALGQAGFAASLWLAFLAGGGTAGAVLPNWGFASLGLPIAVLLVIAGFQLIAPVAPAQG